MASDPGKPRLTVIVAAWNAAATIETALGSVLDHPGSDIECLVVDDGSTDETGPIVEAIAGRDPRLVVIRSPANEGVSAARNRALDAARGEWLTFLDADDRLLPGGLAALLAATETGARAVVGQRISTNGQRTWVPLLYDLPDIRVPGRKSLAESPGLLYYAGPVGKLYHRSCTDGLRFAGRMLGDQPWVVRALLRAGDRIEVIGDVVYEWRRPHPDRYVATITASRERSARLAAEAVAMAAEAWQIVAGEIERTVVADRRHRLRIAYLERLIRADLAAQLTAAVRRGDPEVDELFRALGTFITGIPPEVVASTDRVARDILAPPLARWYRIPPPGRAAYRALYRTAVGIDPALPGKAGGPLASTGLRLARTLPPALGYPAAAALLTTSRLVAAGRRGLRRHG